MSSVDDAPAYSMGKSKRSFKLSDHDQAVPGPASYTIDREFHKEAPKSGLPKAERLTDQQSIISPGPGAYDIPVTIGSPVSRYEEGQGDFDSANRKSNPASSRCKDSGFTIPLLMISVDNHPSVKNSPKVK